MIREEILEKAKPILFNTDIVRAIMEGRKTQTRRVLCENNCIREFRPETHEWWYNGYGYKSWHNLEHELLQKAKYKTGDILYVRETWGMYSGSYIEADYFLYRADYPDKAKTYEFDGNVCDLPKWRPSIYMPKEAARIFLKVTNVRVERLQYIDDDGVVAEGLNIGDPFDELWDSTIKKADTSKYGWEANPWVWVIEFERIKTQ